MSRYLIRVNYPVIMSQLSRYKEKRFVSKVRFIVLFSLCKMYVHKKFSEKKNLEERAKQIDNKLVNQI